jgi:hypothetical protein
MLVLLPQIWVMNCITPSTEGATVVPEEEEALQKRIVLHPEMSPVVKHAGSRDVNPVVPLVQQPNWETIDVGVIFVRTMGAPLERHARLMEARAVESATHCEPETSGQVITVHWLTYPE